MAYRFPEDQENSQHTRHTHEHHHDSSIQTISATQLQFNEHTDMQQFLKRYQKTKVIGFARLQETIGHSWETSYENSIKELSLHLHRYLFEILNEFSISVNMVDFASTLNSAANEFYAQRASYNDPQPDNISSFAYFINSSSDVIAMYMLSNDDEKDALLTLVRFKLLHSLVAPVINRQDAILNNKQYPQDYIIPKTGMLKMPDQIKEKLEHQSRHLNKQHK